LKAANGPEHARVVRSHEEHKRLFNDWLDAL
jgi:hypothetical protein